MKIIAVGRNYRKHAAELNNPVPEEPVIFLKPDTAVIKNNQPFYYPSFSEEVHYEAEIVLRICKEGKHISGKFASSYFDAVAFGIDFTARDLQQKLKEKGLPWEKAKSFDGSAPVSPFVPFSSLQEPENIRFKLDINGKTVQTGYTADMIFSFTELISHVSAFITVRKGDLIFTGTPEGVGEVHAGDHLQGYIEDRLMLDFKVK